MIQVFFLGASSVFGVGGAPGWADSVKKMVMDLTQARLGHEHDVECYNFGKTGAKTQFVTETFESQFAAYHRPRATKSVAVVSVGANDSRAEGSPDNFVCSEQEFSTRAHALYQLLLRLVDDVIVVDGGWFDESKTNPIVVEESGKKLYYTNTRKQLFSSIVKNTAEELGATYINMAIDKETWLKNYTFRDGLHPNQAGHDLIAKIVFDELSPIIQHNSI